MLEELQRRNYSQTTVNTYLKVVEDFARHFHRPPDELGKEQLRAYQVYLLQERKLGVRTVGLHTAALRFFFCKTLKRMYPVEEVPYPRAPRRQAHHAQSPVGSLPRSGAASGNHQTGTSASAAPQLCHPSGGRWSGPADRSGAARAYRPQTHFYLPSSVRAPH